MPSQNRWYAAQVKFQWEMLTRDMLSGRGYDVLLPQCHRNRGDGTDAAKPLFPGYLFFRFSPEATGKIVTCPGVLRVVSFGGEWTPVEDCEIESLQRILNTDTAREPWKHIPVGRRVCVESGPLKGVEGTVIENSKLLVVAITMLQRAVAVALQPDTQLSVIGKAGEETRANSSRFVN